MTNTFPVALITGAARRIGANIVETLHNQNYNIILHYRSSQEDAENLANRLNQTRPNSVYLLKADLANYKILPDLIEKAGNVWDRLDALVNNASDFLCNPNRICHRNYMGRSAKQQFKSAIFSFAGCNTIFIKNQRQYY